MVKKVNHEELETLITRCEKVSKPVFVQGTTGIGKSQKIRETAKQMAGEKNLEFKVWNELTKKEKNKLLESPEDYYVFMDERLAECEPSDIKGIPDLEENGAVEWKLQFSFYYITRPKAKGMVFLDEINLAPHSVQSAFYQLVLDSEVSEYSISDDITVVSAGNRVGKDRAKVYDMSAPLKDRFVQAELKIPTAGARGNWTRWATENGIDDRIVSFLSTPAGQDELFTFDRNKDANVFATPRSWEYASDLIKGVEDLEKAEFLLSTVIGEGVATKLRGFIELREKVDLKRLIENPEAIHELDKKENAVDLKYSVVSGIASEYGNRKGILENLVKIGKELDNSQQSEFGILLLRLAKQKHPRHFKKITQMDEWDDLSEDFRKYLL